MKENIDTPKIEVIDPYKTGQFIKKIRLAQGMSQSELAAKIFLSRKAVSKWETGKSCPSLDVLKRLAVILHATIEEICEGEFADKSKNVDNKPIVRIINSKIFKVSLLVISILLVSGIFINYNNKRTTVYSINTLSNDFYLKNASIVKSGDSEIINFGNFQCDLKDVNDETIYNFEFYIVNGNKEQMLFSHSYKIKENNVLNSKAKILSTIYENNDKDIYLRISYYNIDNEYREYETTVTIKKLRNSNKDYDYSKYNELEEIETVPVVGGGEESTQGMIDIGFLFEMNEEELLQKYLDNNYIINKITYHVMYERNQLYVIQDDMRLSINRKTGKAILKNGTDIIHLKLIDDKIDLSLVSDKHRNNLINLFQIIV